MFSDLEKVKPNLEGQLKCTIFIDCITEDQCGWRPDFNVGFYGWNMYFNSPKKSN